MPSCFLLPQWFCLPHPFQSVHLDNNSFISSFISLIGKSWKFCSLTFVSWMPSNLKPRDYKNTRSLPTCVNLSLLTHKWGVIPVPLRQLFWRVSNLILWLSNCGPQPGTSALYGNLLDMWILRLHPKRVKSETLGRRYLLLSICYCHYFILLSISPS